MRRISVWPICLLSLIVFGVAAGVRGDSPLCSVADYLPADFARDGSVVYRDEIQRAIDEAAESGRTLVFPSITYAADERGWQLHGGSRLRMTGAVFEVRADAKSDGAVFNGRDVNDVELVGGKIVGRNDVWPDGVNVRGVYITGQSSGIRIVGLHAHGLSSNGIGIFGAEGNLIRDVWIEDAVLVHCCNRYPEYLSEEKWEQGSQREDQGLVACYFVEDFVVRGCRLERSRSDGTHFYRCRRGQITDNRIYHAKMGGYFVETCDDVIGRGNVMLGNGSRGTTIERGSRNCIFSGNVVSGSGREGLWAPDCVGLVVTSNVFDRNGRKPNGPERRYIWNANITINDSHGDPSNSPTQGYVVADNIITTTADQVAAIRVDTVDATESIVVRGNLLCGENDKVLIEGPRAAEVHFNDPTGIRATGSASTARQAD